MEDNKSKTSFTTNPQEIFQFSPLKNKSKSIKPNFRLCKYQFLCKDYQNVSLKASSYKISEYPALYAEKTRQNSKKETQTKKNRSSLLKNLRDNYMISLLSKSKSPKLFLTKENSPTKNFRLNSELRSASSEVKKYLIFF